MKTRQILLFTFLFLFQSAPALLAQKNVTLSFRAEVGKVIVTYHFDGDAEKEYEVKLKLKRSNDLRFEYEPSELEGDYGAGNFAGKNLSIVWRLNEDETAMFDGDDFYFELTAIEIETGGFPWYGYLGIAGAAAGGGFLIYTLSNKKEPGIPSTISFPSLPPARP